jgi:DNA-binding transcriptional LysR family regulator
MIVVQWRRVQIEFELAGEQISDHADDRTGRPALPNQFILSRDGNMRRTREDAFELRQLRCLIKLAEEVHFARAAERLKMEQSPLSRAIRDIECTLGVPLSERNTRSTRFTRAGTILLDYARRVIKLVEQGTTSARSPALVHSHQLRIGMSECTAYCRVTEILGRFRAMNPEYSVSIHEMPLQQQIGWIRDGLLDASISLDGSCRDEINSQVIARDSICALIPAVHPLAQAEAVSPTDLAYYSLILFSADSDLAAGSRIDDFVDTLGQPRVAFRANSLGTMLTLVALGHGVGLLGSTQMTGFKRRDVVVRTIHGVTPPLATYVLHSDSGVSEPLKAFIELARERLGEESTAELS